MVVSKVATGMGFRSCYRTSLSTPRVCRLRVGTVFARPRSIAQPALLLDDVRLADHATHTELARPGRL